LAFVLAVGDELVTGRRADGNGVRIGRWLEGLGCRVLARCLVPDDPALIAAALKTALDGGAEVVAVAGGLGPSVDDVTRDGIAAGLGLPLELNPGLLKAVEARYRDFGREMAESAGRQALLPQGAEPIANPMGTAPGFFVDLGRVVVAALPGVPREMEAMLDREVLPRLRARLAGAAVLRTTVLRVAGLPEAEVDRRVRSAGIEPGTAQVTLLPRYGEVEVLVTLRAENDEEADEALPRALRELERRLGDHVYGRDADTLVGAVRDLLTPRGWTLAVAETITGGLLAKNIVDLPGAGRFFVGSLLAHAGMILSLYIQKQHDWQQISFAFGISMLLSPVALLMGRSMLRRLICRMSWWGIPAVIFGGGETGKMIADRLLDRPTLGYVPVAILDDDSDLPDDYRGVPVLRGTDLGPELVARYHIRMAIIAMPDVERKKVAHIVDKYVYPFRYSILVPDFFGMTSIWLSVRDMGGVLGLASTQRLNAPWILAAKRFQDLFITIVGGILVLPFLLLIAFAVKLDSPGPVLYGHRRLGKNGQPFKAWKFRSMVKDADARLKGFLDKNPERRREWEASFKLKDDPRVTRVGRFLRKTSLDEFPQIINVLKGEMSLVGPRPIVEAEIEKYGDAYDRFSRMTPGMTGLWQVSGRSDTGYEERVALDSFYAQSWSVWLDLYILYKTAGVVLHGKGAY